MDTITTLVNNNYFFFLSHTNILKGLLSTFFSYFIIVIGDYSNSSGCLWSTGAKSFTYIAYHLILTNTSWVRNRYLYFEIKETEVPREAPSASSSQNEESSEFEANFLALKLTGDHLNISSGPQERNIIITTISISNISNSVFYTCGRWGTERESHLLRATHHGSIRKKGEEVAMGDQWKEQEKSPEIWPNNLCKSSAG